MTDHPVYTSTLPRYCLQEWGQLKRRVYSPSDAEDKQKSMT